MYRWLLNLAWLVLAAGLAAPGQVWAAPELPPGEEDIDGAFVAPLLPDLRTVPPADLTIEFARGGRRMLRLANLVWNSGAGPLELTGAFNPETEQTIVTQRLALPGREAMYEYVVGEFVYHPLHGHFHLEDFAQYQVWTVTANGVPVELVATGGKLSYCLMETNIMDRSNPNFARRPTHTGCGQETQGILPGWGDRYNAELAGQTVDITDLPPGRYALLSTANPNGALLESDYSNNTGAVLIELRTTLVTILGQPRAPQAEACRPGVPC
jgi:hypothetical protein